MISVLIPSRHRGALLTRSIESLKDNATSSPYLVEYLVMFDPDDHETADVARDVGAKPYMADVRYGYEDLGRYYNHLALMAVGSWLLLWNDDAIMTTPGWNFRIETLPEHVLVADLHTDMSPSVCAFPCVRDKAVQRAGYFCPPETTHSDSYWQEVGRRSGTISPVPVHVHHDRFDLTGNNDDEIFRETRAQYHSDEFYGEVVQRRIDHDVHRLVDDG